MDESFTVTEAAEDPESMRQLKRKWEATETGMWIHYVRSYKYHTGGVR